MDGSGDRARRRCRTRTTSCFNARGEIYFTDPRNKRVWFIDAKGNKRVVHEGIGFPNGVLLSPDQTLLDVADYPRPLGLVVLR